LIFILNFGKMQKSGAEMKENQKTTVIFLFGSFLLIVSLFLVIWQVLLDNEHLRKHPLTAPLGQQSDMKGDAEKTDIQIANGLLKFQCDMMARKYPLFSRVVKTVYSKSREHNIDPKLLMSIIETESAFNPYAVSSAGAYGLMQVNYSIWKDELAIDHQKIFDISYNMELGIKILKNYLKIANNDLHKALYYYNNGFTLNNHGYTSKVISTVFFDSF